VPNASSQSSGEPDAQGGLAGCEYAMSSAAEEYQDPGTGPKSSFNGSFAAASEFIFSPLENRH